MLGSAALFLDDTAPSTPERQRPWDGIEDWRVLWAAGHLIVSLLKAAAIMTVAVVIETVFAALEAASVLLGGQ